MTYLQDNELMAYQIGFDLYESATQDLLSHVRQGLRTTAPVPSLLRLVDPPATAPAGTTAITPATNTTTTTTTTPTTTTTTTGTPSPSTEKEEKTETEGETGDTPMSEEKTLDDLVRRLQIIFLIISFC